VKRRSGGGEEEEQQEEEEKKKAFEEEDSCPYVHTGMGRHGRNPVQVVGRP
jgi:hypothetical protein